MNLSFKFFENPLFIQKIFLTEKKKHSKKEDQLIIQKKKK
jgi:hypothetical protein